MNVARGPGSAAIAHPKLSRMFRLRRPRASGCRCVARARSAKWAMRSTVGRVLVEGISVTENTASLTRIANQYTRSFWSYRGHLVRQRLQMNRPVVEPNVTLVTEP